MSIFVGLGWGFFFLAFWIWARGLMDWLLSSHGLGLNRAL
jgi:hypothetical protein